jgi:hypothetical protein
MCPRTLDDDDESLEDGCLEDGGLEDGGLEDVEYQTMSVASTLS